LTITSTSKGLCWIRRDIRLHDHAALHHCLNETDKTYIVFVFDKKILDPLKAKSASDKRIQFIAESLIALQDVIQENGSSLIISYGDPVEEIPKLTEKLGIDCLYFNRDYSSYALERDSAVTNAITDQGRRTKSFKDCVVFEPDSILNQTGKPYHVFTPYSRTWLSKIAEIGGVVQTYSISLTKLARLQPEPCLNSVKNLLAYAGFSEEKLIFKGGFIEGLSRLNVFSEHIQDYGTSREYPGSDGTSKLSVYLRHGCISVRDMLNMAIEHPGPGSEKWINELIWREFYMMIFYYYPDTKTNAFQTKFKSLVWPTSEAYLEAFKLGQTGFPIIDAAMRCLNQTGWMHNRLRMVTASFLTKILLVDWRRGERYFSWKLLDYELQSNVGGWQWAAGIGCDAAPYFRIFNPTTQSKTYDEDGQFIKEFCPELRHLNNKDIHCPSQSKQLPTEFKLGKDYPFPIVDYASQRQKAIAMFRDHSEVMIHDN